MRTVYAVVATLAVMVAWCLLFLVPLYLVLGRDSALVSSGTEFSPFWLIIAMIVCLAGAAVGGWLVHAWSGRLSAVVMLVVALTVASYAEAGFHAWLRVHPDAFAQAGALLRIGLLMPEPVWYDWTFPAAMAVFAWVAGKSRAIETGRVAVKRGHPALRGTDAI